MIMEKERRVDVCEGVERHGRGVEGRSDEEVAEQHQGVDAPLADKEELESWGDSKCELLRGWWENNLGAPGLRFSSRIIIMRVFEATTAPELMVIIMIR